MSKNKRPKCFKENLACLFKARFPFIYIPTWEEERALVTINSIAQDTNLIKTPRKVFTWTVTMGLRHENGNPVPDTLDPVKALMFVEKFPDPAIYVFKDFHIYFGEDYRGSYQEIIRKIRDITPILKQGAKNVVFLSPTLLLPTELQKDIHIAEFDLPTYEEIRFLLKEMVMANRGTGSIQIELKDDDVEKLVKAALGLTYQEAENAFAFAMANDGRLDMHDVSVILEEKRQIIKKTGILEYVEVDLNLDDVGGLENLKHWLKKRDKSWLDAAQRYCLPAPKGVLITGVPGCGKSLLAKAISAMWQLPLLRFDVGKIFSPFVGTSEENMRKAIQTAEAIAPAILWVDEIEKGFSGVTNNLDGGSSARVFATFLTWMQEKKKPVFVVATANNINSLPPELMRKGRFDEIFFVDLPSQQERMEIFKIHLSKRLKDPHVIGEFQLNDHILANLARNAEGYIGAEIEQAVISALFDAFSEDRSLQYEDVIKALKHTVPLSITQAEQVRALRDWAKTRAVPATKRDEISTRPISQVAADPNVVITGGRTIDS